MDRVKWPTVRGLPRRHFRSLIGGAVRPVSFYIVIYSRVCRYRAYKR